MKLRTKTNNNSLQGYLTAAVTVGTLASTSHAAIVTLDVSSISGTNGGVPSGEGQFIPLSSLSPGLAAGLLGIYNGYDFSWGLAGGNGIEIAVSASDYASPKNFSSGAVVDPTSQFSLQPYYTLFSYDGYNSTDFESSSFIGFRTSDNYYGYLEVTWTAATKTFEILSGAFEDQAGVGIAAGAIPEPSTAVLSLGALAAGAFIRRRKQAA
jgi:hypothetical protein